MRVWRRLRVLIKQRHRIQHMHQIQFGFDSLEAHFHNELRAFYKKRRHWTTQVRYGNLCTSHHSHPPTQINHAHQQPIPSSHPQFDSHQDFPDPETPNIPNPNFTPPSPLPVPPPFNPDN